MRTIKSALYMTLLVAAATIIPGSAQAQEPSINMALARKYFGEAEVLCRKDQGHLWGVSLCGPMLLVNSETRVVVANQADRTGLLKKTDDLFVGKWPVEINISNTAIEWAGTRWTMIIWPLPEDLQNRSQLMGHELFHRIQDTLGLPISDPPNSHLDTRDGRIWLQLEWRALERALMERGAGRRQAVLDALVFRAYRRSLFPQAATEEQALEINEGLAEYTGLRLSSYSNEEFALRAGCNLRQARFKPTFVRSFAYLSGPAYGVLLDESGTNWRMALRANGDLGSWLQRAYHAKLLPASSQLALKRAGSYNGETLISLETARDNANQQRKANYRARFLEQPVLILPNIKMNVAFNPGTLIPLDENSTVYPTLRISDEWGILEVTDGALMIREGSMFKRVLITRPNNFQELPLKGPGWTLQLNEGWEFGPAERKDSYLLKRK